MPGFDALLDEIDFGDRLCVNPDGSKSLNLDYPFEIKVNGSPEMVGTLRLRRPKSRELDIIENAPAGRQSKALRAYVHALVVEPAGLPLARLEDMDAEDYLRLLAVGGSFFQKLKSAAGE